MATESTKVNILGVKLQVIEVKKLEFHIHLNQFPTKLSNSNVGIVCFQTTKCQYVLPDKCQLKCLPHFGQNTHNKWLWRFLLIIKMRHYGKKLLFWSHFTDDFHSLCFDETRFMKKLPSIHRWWNFLLCTALYGKLAQQIKVAEFHWF